MIDSTKTDEALVQELGQRLRTRRLNLNLAADSVAKTIGVSLGTYLRLEDGHGKLITLVAALRALGELQTLDNFLPPIPFSPIQIAKVAGSRRKRGHKRLIKKDDASW